MSSAASRTGLRALIRHPVILAAGGASGLALVAFNLAAVTLGEEAPWLVGAVVIADLMVVVAAIGVGVREALRAQRQTLAAEELSARAEEAIEESAARLAAVIDSAMDAIISVDEAQRIVLFNHAAEKVFGYHQAAALAMPLDNLLPERFRARHRAHIEAFGKSGTTARRMGDVTLLWGLRANGEEFPIEASISHLDLHGRHFYTVILRDVTLRKQYEDQLRQQQDELRELSARVQEAREDEKTHIARELHDELGQLLTALKMDLTWLRERLPRAAPPELSAKAGQMNALLDETVGSVRRISADLRPLMLDDLGFLDAASWLVEDFSRRSGVHCRLDTPADPALSEIERGVAIALYRALQESLTNIARHAEATSARVVLGVEGDELLLEIEDDGRGIRAEDLAKIRALGLRGMRERIQYLGGSLHIGHAPRGGTRILVRVPHRAPAPEPTA